MKACLCALLLVIAVVGCKAKAKEAGDPGFWSVEEEMTFDLQPTYPGNYEEDVEKSGEKTKEQ